MAVTIFPVPVASSLNASALTATSANTMYAASLSLEPAIYTITCTSSTVATVEFYSGVNTLVATGVTVSGSVSVNLGSAVDRVRLWTDTGSNISVTITKTASALTNNFSGTLDTITTVGSSTYTGTSTSGYGYAVLVGAGGGGGGTWNNNGAGGSGAGGGGCGAITGKLVQLTGSLPVTIGAAGTGGTGGSSSTDGADGGNSTFGGMTAGGGKGGKRAPSGYTIGVGGAGGTASGGTYNVDGQSGGNGGNANGSSGNATTKVYSFVVNGTTGSGGGGAGNNGNRGGGAGSGIGTGSDGGYSNSSTPAAATGYGAGGGGAGASNGGTTGGNGAPGVLYVLRF